MDAESDGVARFPSEWLEEGTWRAILARIRPQLQADAAAFRDATALLGAPPGEVAMTQRRWLGDLAGLCLEAIASLGREVFGQGSVHFPRTSSATPAQQAAVTGQLHARHVWGRAEVHHRPGPWDQTAALGQVVLWHLG